MKECSREKVLKGKNSQYDPPNPSRWSVGPGGQQDQVHGVVQHVQGEGYQPPESSRSGSSQVPQVPQSMMSLKFRCKAQVPLSE